MGREKQLPDGGTITRATIPRPNGDDVNVCQHRVRVEENTIEDVQVV